MRALCSLLLAAVLVAACSKNTDPNTTAYWIDRLSDDAQYVELPLQNRTGLGG